MSSVMPERPIVYIDTSTIREVKLEELEVAMGRLATLYSSGCTGTRGRWGEDPSP